jgi:hypothetical protein
MELTVQSFLETLFDRGEHACISADVYGTKSMAVFDTQFLSTLDQASATTTIKRLITINPLFVGYTRCDKHVAQYRSILVECDKGVCEKQLEIIRGAGMPYSTCVFSGNKSLHFVISLISTLPDRKSYDHLVNRIYRALYQCGIEVDQNCKNPSRSTRWPNAIRDNGQLQHLIEVNGRIENSQLEDWLIRKGSGPEPIKPRIKLELSVDKGHLSGWTQNYIMFGSQLGRRNSDLFKAACDYAAKGFTEAEAFVQLLPISDLPEPEVRRTISSAFRKVAESLAES